MFTLNDICDFFPPDAKESWGVLDKPRFLKYKESLKKVEKIRYDFFLKSIPEGEYKFLMITAPEDLAEEMLRVYDKFFYKGSDNTLRSCRLNSDDVEISVFDAYKEYGKYIIMEAQEYGSITI